MTEPLDQVVALHESLMAMSSVKLPEFWKANPDLWFLQVEAQFHTRKITSEYTKYYAVIGALNAEALQEVSDLIRAPVGPDSYRTLKENLVKRFTDSIERQLHKLLTECELGDKKPSQLLRYIRTLAGTRATEDLLRTKWLGLLPETTHKILKVVQGVTLDQLADLADSLMENNSSAYIMATNPYSRPTSTTTAAPTESVPLSQELGDIKTLLVELTNQNKEILAKLSKPSEGGHHSRPRSTDRSQHGSRSASPESLGLCFYHARFGNKAHRCTRPCTYVETSAQGEN